MRTILWLVFKKGYFMTSAQTVCVFPGQGSQSVGMSSEFMTHPVTRHLFEEANDTLGFDIARIMREDESALKLTENTQPALLIAGMAAVTYLMKQTGKTFAELCSYTAGHSLGEFTALTAAGSLTFADALKLVHARGQAMAAAVPNEQGTMAAVIGLPIADVDSTARSTGCFVANDNSELQHIISGSVYAIDEASNILVMQDAKKVMRLDVAGPFHTPYMEPAADKIKEILAEISLKEPSIPVVMNATAEPTSDVEVIAGNLVIQATTMVRWRETMLWLADNGINTLYELGAGKVLSKLASRDYEGWSAQAFTSPDEVDNWLDAQAAA